MANNRFSVADSSYDDKFLKEIIIGKAFAFLPSNALKKSGFSWISRLLSTRNQNPAANSEVGAQAQGSANRTSGLNGEIVSLLGHDAIELFGLKIEPIQLKPLSLASVTSDKPIYKSEKDQINLLVLSPLTPEVRMQLDVLLNDQEYSCHSVELGRSGQGSLILADLPVGQYDVVSGGESLCQFTVAEYRLVPLVASVLDSRTLQPDQLAVVLQVESFGSPVNGDIRVEVMNDRVRISSQTATCIDGQMKVVQELSGNGPHSLVLQLVKDAMKTASVPLRGTRIEERTQTTFSPLGLEVVGSLIKDPTATEVRGIYLGTGATRTSPFRLEQVDATSAKLIANTKVDKVVIVAVNPAFPRRTKSAVHRESAPHPDSYDENYRRATQLFNVQKDYAGACRLFEKLREPLDVPHPYYSYWIACCKAKMGDIDGAIKELKRSFMEGWDEFEHLANDADLCELRGKAEFEALLQGGLAELVVEDVQAGQMIEVPGFSPATVIVIGAFVNGKAWEGWTSLVAPSKLSLSVKAQKTITPGELVEIEVACGLPDSSCATIYSVVKDARLLSTDTPYTRLASGVKAYIESASKDLPLGFATEDLAAITAKCAPQRSAMAMSRMMIGTIGGAFSGMPSEGSSGSADAWGSPAGSWGQPAGSGMQARARLSSMDSVITGSYSVMQSPQSMPVSSPPMQAQMMNQMADRFDSLDAEPTASHANDQMAMTSDPEVLFAGFVPVKDGKALITAKLPDCFADYVIECFAIDGFDWSWSETRFRAEKYPFVTLTTPVFASANENARGRMHVLAGTQDVRVRLARGGQPVELKRNATVIEPGEMVSGTQDLEFSAVPGTYEAILEREDGTIVSQCTRQVDKPGRLKRRVRSLRLLEEGQSVSLAETGGLVRLQAMPGIENSFKQLVEATADYSHCCCEQTAAKIVSGCAMYLLSEDDEQRKKAESIILAGVRREKNMWLKGRGFKVYPESTDSADSYLGRAATGYLWNLSLLNGDGDLACALSSDLKQAIREGLEMAKDATDAYRIQWPPQKFGSCSDAYAASRFSGNGTAQKALTFVQQYLDGSNKAELEPQPAYMGRLVVDRTEKGFAAATLLREGGATNLAQALKVADEVISQCNEDGRLYSTRDSVAAIALMSELQNANVTGGGAEVEVDGRKMTVHEANLLKDPVSAIKVLKGVAMVAADRIIEEDWSKFAMTASVKVALEVDGKPISKLAPGDAVELTVALENGYVNGDLLWVCLPDALSRIVGGGQVKLFSLDFEGATKVTVPLAATATTVCADGKPQPQFFAVCVRNMFDEERGGSPGLIPITVLQ